MRGLAITLVGGIVAVATVICVTVLIVYDKAIPAEMWALLGSSSTAAFLGGAVSQGAQLANPGTPHLDRFYRDRTR